MLGLSRVLGTCLLRESHCPWQSLDPSNSTEAGQPTWRLSVKWKRPWTSMLVFTVAGLGMFGVPLAADACGICHEIPSHPLLSQGTVSR